ncbi:MAG: CBS domain-containing protein [Bdellovibrionales bacterium]
MKFEFSAYHIVESDITILQGLKVMKEFKLSYLLLKNPENVVSGIFTKTDLLDLILAGSGNPNVLNIPFHQWMTKKLKTLPLRLMDTAPEFMKQNNISHLPIVELNRNTGREEVVGMVTTRNIFDFAVGHRGLPPIFGGPPVKKTRKIIGILSPDGMTFRILEKVFSRSKYVGTQRFRFSSFDFIEVAKQVDALVVDIDGMEKRVWFPIVEAAAQNPDLESVCIVFDNKKHENLEDKLEPLEALGFFKLYEKPLNLTLLITDLEKRWATN